jgi:hypothetical protein
MAIDLNVEDRGFVYTSVSLIYITSHSYSGLVLANLEKIAISDLSGSVWNA